VVVLFKLGFDYVYIPFAANLHLGWLFLPFFILVVVANRGFGKSDRRAGRFGRRQPYDRVFCFWPYRVFAGQARPRDFYRDNLRGLLAFLWFNVFPARFIMGDTGSMGLGVLLAVVAFLTNSVFYFFCRLSVLYFLLEAVSTIVQAVL